MPGPLGIGGGGGGSGGTVTTPVFPFIDRAVAQTSDTGSITYATPGSSAIGDTATAGTATTVSRSDHVHGREAAGTPGASAVGDTASAGVATTVARSDHRHSREAFGTPVNIDASLTSLSAGSLTTVARADHIHTLSKVPVLLASTTLASSAANITWTSIPQTYSSLKIVGNIFGTQATTYTQIKMRVNSDTTTSYHCQSWEPTGSYYTNTDALYLGWMPCASNYFPKCNFVDVILTNYTGSQQKIVNSNQTINASTTSTLSILMGMNSSIWNNTAAITELSIFASVGNLASGSTLKLYGLP